MPYRFELVTLCNVPLDSVRGPENEMSSPLSETCVMHTIHTCSQEGGISRQQMVYPRGLRASILFPKGMPREEPPRRRIHHSRKMGYLHGAMQLLVISKMGEADENNEASSM
jgi:hypothetical protein